MIYHIGFPKTGSTFFHQVIKQNEQFDCPFSKDHSTFSWKKDSFNEVKYSKLFKNNNKIKFDFDHALIFDYKGLKLLRKNFTDVKVVLVLRDSEDLLISNYLYQISQGKYSLNRNSFNSFLVNEKHEIFIYGHIRKLFEIFDNKNILILHFEDLKNNLNKFLKDLEIFINCENISVQHSNIVNKARKPRFSSNMLLIYRRLALILRDITPSFHTALKNNKYINKIFFKEIGYKDKNIIRSWINTDLKYSLKSDANKTNLLLLKNRQINE